MAHGGNSCAACSCNAVLHCMDMIQAAHIAYAAVLVSFNITMGVML